MHYFSWLAMNEKHGDLHQPYFSPPKSFLSIFQILSYFIFRIISDELAKICQGKIHSFSKDIYMDKKGFSEKNFWSSVFKREGRNILPSWNFQSIPIGLFIMLSLSFRIQTWGSLLVKDFIKSGFRKIENFFTQWKKKKCCIWLERTKDYEALRFDPSCWP